MDKNIEATDNFMKKLPLHRLLIIYILEKRRVTGFFMLTMLLFFIVCLLYQLDDIYSLLYAFFLWAFLALCFATYDFIKYIKKIRTIQIAFENIENIENIAELLPLPAGGLEKLYHETIDTLLEELRQLKSQINIRDTDMSDYYTMWAHQIKIPIAAMRLLLQSIGDKPPQTDNVVYTVSRGMEASHYRLLSEELFKIEHYVDMVLYYQRLDSITSDFLFKNYELHDIVKQAIKKHKMFFINSRRSLNLEDFSCSVVTDSKWLLFVIGQLLSNALKYTQRGSISIRHEMAEGKALLIIEDTGIGIRQEDLPRIFERGYTGYNGRLDKKSTGIGLYLCKQIMKKLSHTLEVSSEVGSGTKVTIGFPETPEIFS